MKNLPEYELFSAYLDGELTADERAQVEQLLAGNPAARQLLDEMRALSSTLQTLPVLRLEENLSQRVLRVAERRMLSGSASPEPPADASPPTNDGAPSIGRQLLRPRTWLWPAVAVAAALLMWFRTSEVAEPVAARKLARAPKAEALGEPPSIQAPGALADKAVPWGREAGEAQSAAPAMPGAPAATPSVDAFAEKAPAEEPAFMEPPKQSLKAAENQEEAASEVRTFKSAKSAPPAAEPSASQPTPTNLAADAPAPSRHGGEAAPHALKAKASEATKAGEMPLLIVQCELTRETARQQVFHEILAAEPLRRFDDSRLRKGMSNLKQDSEQGTPMMPWAMMSVPGGSAVEFTATRDEVSALLAKLKARPDLVVSVPEPAQLGLLGSDMKSAPQARLPASGKNRAETSQQAYSLKGQQEARRANEAEMGVGGRPTTQSQGLAQDRLETAQQAMPNQADFDEPTYRVRVELRVVSDPAIAGEQAKPAQPATAPPNAAPATTPTKGKP